MRYAGGRSEDRRFVRLVRGALHPVALVLTTSTLSFAAWLAPWPDELPLGFVGREPLSSQAVLTLLAWYIVVVVAAFLGFAVGRRLTALRVYDSFPDDTYYYYLSALALFGVVYTYGKVIVEEPELIPNAFANRTFNALRWYLDYSPGLHTFRYAAILAGGIALYRLVLAGEVKLLHVGNLALLVGSAAIASRMSFIMALMIAFGLLAYRDPPRFQIRRVATIVGSALLALVFFNHIRNAGFYEERAGVTNPFTAALYQSAAYLAVPFQASVAVARSEEPDEQRENKLSNGGAESGTRSWVGYGEFDSETPTLRRSVDERYVAGGRSALVVSAPNPDRVARSKFVWNYVSIPVSTGDRYLLSARVSGRADSSSPIVLAVRRPDTGAFATTDLTPVRHGLVKTNSRNKWLLEGIYRVPPGVQEIQLAVWKKVRARSVDVLALDSVTVSGLGEAAGPLAPAPPTLRGIARYIVPTYAPWSFPEVAGRESLALEYGRLDNEAWTTSTYAPMSLAIGLWAFPLMATIGFLAGGAVGHGTRYASYFALSGFVIAYAFADLWRVYLFNYGIVHFLLYTLLLVPVFHHGVSLAVGRLRGPRRDRPERRAPV